MLHRQLLDRFLIAATALAVWALATPSVEMAGADAAQATIVSPGGGQQTLSLDALAGGEDVVGRDYVLRSGAGESSQVLSGFSLAALLEAAGADPYAFSFLEVLRPAGGAVLLSRHQALDEGAFADGPPVVYATAAGTGFLRPSSGSGDLNGSDSFEAPQGVTIALRRGAPLQVRVEASTLRTHPGKPVEFTALVDRAGAGERLTYSWYFDDGTSAAGATAVHRFSRRGSYNVVVGVTTPGDDTGTSAVVNIQVGAPPPGPDRRGGGRRRDRRAPDHGAATGTGGEGGATSSASEAPMSLLSPYRRQRRQSHPQSPPRQVPDGEVVRGRLLSMTAPSSPKPQAQPAARTGKPDGEEAAGFSLPAAALGLLVTGGLLGLGALTEARSLLR